MVNAVCGALRAAYAFFNLKSGCGVGIERTRTEDGVARLYGDAYVVQPLLGDEVRSVGTRGYVGGEARIGESGADKPFLSDGNGYV